MTPETSSPLDPHCPRATVALAAAFPRDLPASELADLDDHATSCRRCASVLAQARDQERLLRAWIVPSPTARSADRFVAAIMIDAAQREVCARKRGALEEALRDERVDPQVAALRAHVTQCPACSEAWSTDHAADRLLREWPAPRPPRHFVDAVVLRLRAAGVLRHTQASNPSRWTSLWTWSAAAAVLLGTFAWLAVHAPPAADVRSPDATPIAAVDVDRALERFGGNMHVVNVMNSQFPAGIGSFAPTAVALERAPTQPGAGFHRALRKVRRDTNGGGER